MASRTPTHTQTPPLFLSATTAAAVPATTTDVPAATTTEAPFNRVTTTTTTTVAPASSSHGPSSSAAGRDETDEILFAVYAGAFVVLFLLVFGATVALCRFASRYNSPEERHRRRMRRKQETEARTRQIRAAAELKNRVAKAGEDAAKGEGTATEMAEQELEAKLLRLAAAEEAEEVEGSDVDYAEIGHCPELISAPHEILPQDLQDAARLAIASHDQAEYRRRWTLGASAPRHVPLSSRVANPVLETDRRLQSVLSSASGRNPTASALQQQQQQPSDNNNNSSSNPRRPPLSPHSSVEAPHRQFADGGDGGNDPPTVFGADGGGGRGSQRMEGDSAQDDRSSNGDGLSSVGRGGQLSSSGVRRAPTSSASRPAAFDAPLDLPWLSDAPALSVLDVPMTAPLTDEPRAPRSGTQKRTQEQVDEEDPFATLLGTGAAPRTTFALLDRQALGIR